MNKIVRWGILGAAKIAREHVAPELHAARYGTLTAIATTSDATAEEWVPRYPDITIHRSYEALLADPAVDAIYIPLPNHMHVEWTQRALSAGKHVLCEKPIALEAAEIDELIRARDAAGVMAAEAFMVTHHPQWYRVREIIQSGEIGELKVVQGAFAFNNGTQQENIRNRPETGGGALRDIGVYPSVTTRFVTGAEPIDISAHIDWENGIDAAASVRAIFPTFSLEFYVSMRLGARQEMSFHGTDGFIVVESPFNAGYSDGERIRIRLSDGTERIERFCGTRQYLLQAEAFNRSVLTGEPFLCPLEFSRGNQEMIDMIYRSGR